MLDSALEFSYNLSKKNVLLPWILRLRVDMVNDSTLLKRGNIYDKFIFLYYNHTHVKNTSLGDFRRLQQMFEVNWRQTRANKNI